MRFPRFDPRRLSKFIPGLMALALVLCLCGAVAAPVSAASMDTPMLTATGTENIVDDTLNVFTKIGDWLAEAIPSFMPMFYSAETGLTFIGVLSIVGLGFSVIFLCLGLIQKFMRWG